MFYRQGMIIPNHPNNNGTKPILIGLASQVSSQKNYIYRGNYGLVSKEEIQKCGIKSEYADDLFRLKLKFAFGELKSADSLFESCIVEQYKVEIRDGVFIERKRPNVFEFSYKDENVIVDLNLAEQVRYFSPYTLPIYDTKREYFSVIHSGQGDGWDVSRASMNSIITFQGRLYLVDVVPNIKSILKSLSIDISEIEGVFQTHTHDDHIGGITSLIRSDKKIKFYATPLVISATTKKLSALLDIEEKEFYNLLDIKELELDKWNNVYGLEVRPIISPHPVETTIFTFRTLFEDGYKTYGHFADIIDMNVLKNMIVSDKNDIGISLDFYNKVGIEYKQKLDLKKIDIGGGIIHGNSQDFIDDQSSKIVLAHNSTKLTKDDKRVGSSSLFGLSDVLIPANQNYDFTILYNHMASNFPNMEYYQRKMFLNFKIVRFDPETIIIKEEEEIENAYLLLNGHVEGVSSNSDTEVTFTPGLIIGEKTTFTGVLPVYTYVAKNYVRALEIPVKFFYSFIESNNLIADMLNKISKRMFLLRTKLFKDEITYATLDKITANIKEDVVRKGKIDIDKKRVYLVVYGKVTVKVNDNIIDNLGVFDDFGGVAAILDYPSPCTYEADEEVVLYSISSEILGQIPIIRWRMFELAEKVIDKFDKIKT